MAKSGFIRSSVTVSEETTGYHHTRIAVFLGKSDFADASSSGQAACQLCLLRGSLLNDGHDRYEAIAVCLFHT